MSNKYLIIFFFSSICFAQLPYIAWQKTFGGISNDNPYCVRQTSDGGYIMAGTTPFGTPGYSQAWLIKTDSIGNIEWQKKYGGTNEDFAFQLEQTADGGYIIAGGSYSNNGDLTSNYGYTDCWILKLDNLGTIQWQRNYGSSGYDGVSEIIQLPDGNYIFAGNSTQNNGDVTGNHGANDAWIVKLDSLGNILWQKSLGGSNYDTAHSIKQTVDGGYIVAGVTNSTNGDVTVNHGLDDIWLVKLDQNGSIQWQKTIGGSGNDWYPYIAITTDGGFVLIAVTGSNNGDVSGNHGGSDSWVVKMSNAGAIQWQKTFGGLANDNANRIKQTSDGGYVFAGSSGSANLVEGYMGNFDSWIVRIDSIGNIIWQKFIGGTGFDCGYDIDNCSNGGFIVISQTESNDMDVSGNHGARDFWLTKINLGQLSVENQQDDHILVFPNPAKDYLQIEIPDTSIINTTIYDITGKAVLEFSGNQKTFVIEKLPEGIYFLKAISAKGIFQSKFVKQ